MTDFLQVTSFDPLIVTSNTPGPQGPPGSTGPAGPPGGVYQVDGQTGAIDLTGKYQDVITFSAYKYGAVGDGLVTAGSVTSGSNHVMGSGFTAAMQGRQFWLQGAGTAGAVLAGIVTSVDSSTQLTVNVTASTTASSTQLLIGTDSTAALQSAINAAKQAALAVGSSTGLGAQVLLPAGVTIITAPLVLPRTGITPTQAVQVVGVSSRSSYLVGAPTFTSGQGMIQWDTTISRAWHQGLKRLRLRLPLVSGARGVYFQKQGAGTTTTDFNNERFQIDMEDVVLEGHNGYHSELCRFDGQIFYSTFDRVYGDNASTFIPGFTYSPASDSDTITLSFETSNFGGGISSDISGLAYSRVMGGSGGSLRRGGLGTLLKGRLKDCSVVDAFVNGTRVAAGVDLYNSFNVLVRNVNNEGMSGPQIQVTGSRGVALEDIALSAADPVFDDWTATTAYALNQGVILPGWRTNVVPPAPANNNWYKCTTAGTTGGSQPTWPTTPGATVVDGTVTWTCMGPAVSDGIIFDSSTKITLLRSKCDPGQATFGARGVKAVRYRNGCSEVRARDCEVPGDPFVEVAWDSAQSGVGEFTGARGGEHVRFGRDLMVGDFGPLATGSYRQPQGANVGTRTMTVGQEFMIPVKVNAGQRIASVSCNVSTAVAGGVVRLGIRADNGGVPGSLLADLGTVDASTTGVKEATAGTAVVVPSGVAWVTATGQGTGTVSITGLNGPVMGIDITTNAAASAAEAAWLQASVSGALPAGVTSPAPTAIGPLLAIKGA